MSEDGIRRAKAMYVRGDIEADELERMVANELRSGMNSSIYEADPTPLLQGCRAIPMTNWSGYELPVLQRRTMWQYSQ
jgi:hypothetical protein